MRMRRPTPRLPRASPALIPRANRLPRAPGSKHPRAAPRPASLREAGCGRRGFYSFQKLLTPSPGHFFLVGPAPPSLLTFLKSFKISVTSVLCPPPPSTPQLRGRRGTRRETWAGAQQPSPGGTLPLLPAKEPVRDRCALLSACVRHLAWGAILSFCDGEAWALGEIRRLPQGPQTGPGRECPGGFTS